VLAELPIQVNFAQIVFHVTGADRRREHESPSVPLRA